MPRQRLNESRNGKQAGKALFEVAPQFGRTQPAFGHQAIPTIDDRQNITQIMTEQIVIVATSGKRLQAAPNTVSKAMELHAEKRQNALLRI